MLNFCVLEVEILAIWFLMSNISYPQYSKLNFIIKEMEIKCYRRGVDNILQCTSKLFLQTANVADFINRKKEEKFHVIYG